MSRLCAAPVCALAITFPLRASAAALPEPAAAAQDALAKICLPATEKSLAPRDLATAQGLVREATPPDYVLKLFPASQLGSASFVEPVSGGALHVVSTVAPPPANPFSCLIILDVDAPGLVDAVKARFSGTGTRYSYMPELSAGSPAQGQYVVALNAADASTKAVDKIMAMSAPTSKAGFKALLLTYRVDPASDLAGQQLKTACASGTAPPQLCHR